MHAVRSSGRRRDRSANGHGAPVVNAPAAETLLVNLDAEESVIGAGFVESAAVDRARGIVGIEDFDSTRNRLVLAAMFALRDAGSPIDPPLIVAQLDRSGTLHAAGGREYVTHLMDVVPTAANVEYYAGIVADMARRRRLGARGVALRSAAFDLAIPTLDVARREREILDDFLHTLEAARGPIAIRASDVQQAPPLRWIVEGLWPAGEIGLFVGDGGSFKSTVAVYIAAAIANGASLFGRFRVARGPSLIVSAEDPADVVLMRLHAFVVGHGWNRRILEHVHIIAEPDASLSEPSFRAQLTGEIARIGPAFVILDPLAELLGGDENSNTDLRPVMKYLRSLARSSGAGIGIVHHAGKAGPDKRTLDRIRGASALASACRTILFFDFHPGGVLLTNLKNSRAQKIDPFVVERHIETVEGDRGTWVSATLTVSADRTQGMTRAAGFVLSQLKMSPGLSTSDLKRSAAGTGLSGEDIGRALSALQAENLIGWSAGKKGAKLWTVNMSVLPDPDSGKLALSPQGLGGYSEGVNRVNQGLTDELSPGSLAGALADNGTLNLADLALTLPRQAPDLAGATLPPLRGQARSPAVPGLPARSPEDLWEPDESQAFEHDSTEFDENA